jgi:hypothetical protein
MGKQRPISAGDQYRRRFPERVSRSPAGRAASGALHAVDGAKISRLVGFPVLTGTALRAQLATRTSGVPPWPNPFPYQTVAPAFK